MNPVYRARIHPMQKDKIRIFYYPFSPGLNPYFRLLRDAIETQHSDIDIEMLDLDRLSFREIFRIVGKKSIIHHHWVPELSRDNGGLGSLWQYRRIIRSYAVMTLLRAVNRVLIIWTVHNANVKMLATQQFWTPFLHRLMERISDGLIFHCKDSMRDYFPESPGKPYAIIPHGHNIGVYGPPISDHTQARRLLGIPQNKIVFLILGWLRKYKQLDWLLKALHEYQDERAAFVVAGMTQGRSSFPLPNEILSDPRFILVNNFVPMGYMRWVLAAADFNLNAQQRGYVSGVTLLALSYGLPVINIRWGCAPAIVRNRVNGLLFRRDTLHRVLDEAVRIRLNTARYRRMKSEALESAARFDWELIGRHTGNFYKHFLEHEKDF